MDVFLLEKGKSKETQFSDMSGERNYTRGEQTFVYWGWNFSTAKNIEVIFGDLRCNSRLGRMFHHVASMYYIFTNFSKWLPRSTKKKKKMFGRYKFVAIHRILLTVKMIRLRKQTSDFRLTSVQIVWKIAVVIFISWCYTTPLLRKASIRDSVTLFHLTFT